MSDDRQCHRCGGTDEFLYEIGGAAIFYCAGCKVRTDSTHEVYGAKEKAVDEAGR